MYNFSISSIVELFLIQFALQEITLTFPFVYPNSGKILSSDGLLFL